MSWANRLFRIDLRSLALFRIGIALILLGDLVGYRFPEFSAFYADDGMFSVRNARDWMANSSCWSVCWLDVSNGFQLGMLALTAIFATLLLIGWQTRWMTVACWIMTVSIANRNPIVCNYGDTMLQVFLFWSLFLPLGARWSLDARRRKKRNLAKSKQAVCSVASAAILLQLCFVYFFTGLWKWNADWLGGGAADTALQLEYARRDTSLDQMIYAPLLRPLTLATLYLELLGPFLVWIPWRNNVFRYAMIVAFVMLHVSIELLFTPALLSYMCILGWMLFVPSTFWDSRLVRRLFRCAESDSDTSECIKEVSGISRVRVFGHRLAGGVCLFLLGYVLLWNVWTFQPERYRFLMPKSVQWIGEVTMLGQKWDMFYRPSQHNGWFKARARLANGDIIDLLREGESYDANQLESNWSYYRSIRWKLFFRRLGIWEQLVPLGNPVAEYLRNDWSETQPEDRRAVEVKLMYFERTDDSRGGGFTVRQSGIAMSDDTPSWELMMDPLDAMNSGDLFPSNPLQ
ncbi:MAG: HTTM domain-containing protein [Planctomycetota bacterium]